MGSRNAEVGIKKKWEVGMRKWEVGIKKKWEVGMRKLENGNWSIGSIGE